MGISLLHRRERTILGFVAASVGIVAVVIGAYSWLYIDAAGRPETVQAWVELGAIGAGAILGLVLMGRWVRGRMLSMSALREAVLASENHKAAPSELRLADRFGPEAGAWNALVDRLQEGPARKTAGHEPGIAAATGDGQLATSVCSALWQGVLVVGPGLDIRFANTAAVMLLGVDLAELQHKPLTDVLDVSALVNAPGGHGLRRGTIELDRTIGEATSHLRITVRDGQGMDGHVVVIEDITQLNAAEEARANFIAHATHELRTPLTNMRLYAETALGDDCDEAMLGTCLNVINQEVRRLERVVSDMLSVSEMEAGALSIQEGEVRLDQLFEELRLEFENQAKGKGVTLKFTLPPKLPVVRGDRDKLLQAYHNVLGNAIKYTPEGGVVTLSADWGDEGLDVSVRDTGVGIAEADRQRIFERFYRTDDVRASGTQGTGLGLTLAKEIMLGHEGGIDVDSEPGKGSVFTMFIPGGRLVA
ncbi:MAG: ATP-binding protein [Phycisphaerales bacterium]|jgi:signal transduction histidine kinase